MKRYYTIEDLKDDPDDRLGERRQQQLQDYAEERGVKWLSASPDYREDLAKLGVLLLNKQHYVEYLDYGDMNKDTVNNIEQEIKHFAGSLSIKLHDVRATIDYDVLIPKICEGLSIFHEDVIVPQTHEEYIRRVFKHIDALDSAGKTVILTDPYLFKDGNNSYIEDLENYLDRTKAGKIVCYMPRDEKHYNHNVYEKVESYLNKKKIVIDFKEYELCHDRFWICQENKNGFCMGTSLNGLGRKICRIDDLELPEVEVLLAELMKEA